MSYLVTYFEIGGKLVELEDAIEDLTSLRSSRTPETTENIFEVLKLLDTLEPAVENLLSSNSEVTWEDVGKLTGAGLSVAMAIATLPMVAADGPLPIMDAAWWALNLSRTVRYVGTGAKVGSYIDEHIDTKPSDIYHALNYQRVKTTNSLLM